MDRATGGVGPVPDADVRDNPSSSALELGEPFAISHDCELLRRDDEAGIPGCRATVRCDCGQMFAVDLLADGEKVCPGCELEYGHVLLVAPADDPAIVAEALALWLEAAGIDPSEVAAAMQEADDGDQDGDGDQRHDGETIIEAEPA